MSLASSAISSFASLTSLNILKKHKSPTAGVPAIVTAPLSAVTHKSSAAPNASSSTTIAVPYATSIVSLSLTATPCNPHETPSVSVAVVVQ